MEVDVVEIGAAAVAREFGGGSVDDDDFAGVGDGQRAEDECVRDAEDGGVGADAKREREYDDECEDGISANVAEGEKKVAPERFDVMAGACLADVFF